MSEFASLLPYPVQLFIIAILGLALGSFATALTHRVPKGMDWGLFQKTRSQCPSCGKTLGAVDLVPVFSWVFLKGRCRQCKAPISPVYPLVELLTVAAVLGVYAAFGPTVQGLIAICAMPFLAALLAIDLKQYILPDALVLVLFLLGLAFHGLEALDFLISAAAYALILWALGWGMSRILKKDALGFGDVKFFGVCGLWLGFAPLSALCLIAGLSGVVLGIIWKLAFKSEIFPFGPSLIVAFYLCLILQELAMI